MFEYTFTADGSTPWYRAGMNEVHLSGDDTWGGGTLSLEKQRGGAAVPMLDSGVAVTYTTDFDDVFALGSGEIFRLTLNGSTSPNLILGIGGNSSKE